MKVMTGTVVDGKVELPAEFVSEGARVMILAPQTGEPARLSPAEEAELLEAAEQIKACEFVDGQALLDELRSRAVG
jgi:hypothetical protein